MDIEKRNRRAKSIAAMGLVTRDGDRFKVSAPSLRGHQPFNHVSRSAEGRIVCDCLEFGDEIERDSGFRCEHILAVKEYLVAKTKTASAK